MKVKKGKFRYKKVLYNEGDLVVLPDNIKKCLEKAGIEFDNKKILKLKKAGKKK